MSRDRDNKNKEKSKETTAPAEIKVFSEKIMEILNIAESMLNDAPRSLEVRSALIRLNEVKGSLAQAGKFQKTSPTDKE